MNVLKLIGYLLKESLFQSSRKFLDIGIKHSTSVSNGTVALYLALHTLGIGPNDKVILPTLTYVATANSVAYVGAKPVFVDSEDTWNINPEKIISK